MSPNRDPPSYYFNEPHVQAGNVDLLMHQLKSSPYLAEKRQRSADSPFIVDTWLAARHNAAAFPAVTLHTSGGQWRKSGMTWDSPSDIQLWADR